MVGVFGSLGLSLLDGLPGLATERDLVSAFFASSRFPSAASRCFASSSCLSAASLCFASSCLLSAASLSLGLMVT